jgi:hypothetical protein
MSPLAVTREVDETCKTPEDKKMSIRDILYLVNIELSLKHAKPVR